MAVVWLNCDKLLSVNYFMHYRQRREYNDVRATPLQNSIVYAAKLNFTPIWALLKKRH
jgi:hypothetical protein